MPYDPDEYPGSYKRRKYCDINCRKGYMRAVRAAAKAEINATVSTKDQSQAITPYVKAAKALAFDGMEDEIRDTLREEVRAQVKTHLQDNILGAVEAMTALLPMVLVRLAEDVDHPDWMRSSRAQNLLLKYAIAFKDTTADDKDDTRRIEIYHNVPIPEGPLGDRMIEAVDSHAEIIEAQSGDPNEFVDLPPEDFEVSWPSCTICEQRKHPNTFVEINPELMTGLCRSCSFAKGIKTNFGRGTTTDGLDGSGELGLTPAD
jgi:hypothetical protein